MPAFSIMRTGVILSATLFMAVTLMVAQEGQTTIKKVRPSRTPADSGETMYREYCAVCHGTDGRGGGPAAPALKGPIPDLTTLAKRHGGSYPSSYVDSVLRFGTESFPAHGSKDMPMWGPVFQSMSGSSRATTNLRVHNLAQYLETLQAK